MKKRLALLVLAPLASFAQPQVTIYNDNFAVVKDALTLELKKGENDARVSDLTAHLEPDSVILRDRGDPGAIQILEQNYESDPLSEGLLLRKSEGKTIDFEIPATATEGKKIVKGTILRSGYVPHASAYERYGRQYAMSQQAYASPQGGGQPIVEIDGRIMFGLPGKPIFDALDPGSFLKPTLLWKLLSKKEGKRDLEFSYITGGMRWEATYNAVAPEKGDAFDIVGWVTLENMSGKDLNNASVKLMAGDVARARPEGYDLDAVMMGNARARADAPAVTEKAFEEYHLYTLERPTSLLDREIKQVEFVRAANVPAQRIYVYDGFVLGNRYRHYDVYSSRAEPGYGTESSPKIWVMLEFKNSKDRGLGMALPKGTVKVYRRDTDGRNEFIGEDRIDHTPVDETVRLYTGNAFDITGERRQTDFKVDTSQEWVRESFEIKVRNHKKEPVQVRVVEHLYRWLTWSIEAKSMDFAKTDARTIEFRPTIPPDGEAVITYTAYYSW